MSSDSKPPVEELLKKLEGSPFFELLRRNPQAYTSDINTDLKPVHAQLEPVPRIEYTFTVTDKYANLSNNLHGGATATIFDVATTQVLLLINSDKFWYSLGVSRTLNVTYLQAAPVGKTVKFVCEIISIGKRMAQFRGEMFDSETGKLMAVCEHGKVNVDSKL